MEASAAAILDLVVESFSIGSSGFGFSRVPREDYGDLTFG